MIFNIILYHFFNTKIYINRYVFKYLKSIILINFGHFYIYIYIYIYYQHDIAND